MELKITKLRIKNFRNINELEIEFEKPVTEIVAENGKGKTNTLSAIMWCLFGKNIYDVKQFPISPIVDGEERNDLTTNVTLIINDDYVISRTYYQRKTTVQTGCIIDGIENLVTVTQNQYNEELKNKFIDEETFKSLSNINYVPNLNWKDLKQLIFSLVGDVDDKDILLRGEFNLIEDLIKSAGLDKTREMLNNTDKNLDSDIKKLETEYQTKLNIKEKFVADNEELDSLKSRKEEIEKTLKNHKEKQEEQKINQELHKNKQNEIDKIELEIQDKNNTIEFNKKAIDDYKKSYELNSVSIDVIREKEISYVQNKIDSINQRLSELDIQTKEYEKELEDYKQKGKELQEKKIKVENDTCNVCGQKLPQEKIDEVLNALKQQQLTELQTLQNKVNNLTTIIGSNSSEYEQKTIELKDLQDELEKVKTKEYKIEDESEKQKEIRIAREEKELENKTLENEKNDLKQQLDKLLVEKSQLPILELADLSNGNLLEELNEINDKLATTTTLEKLNDELENTQKNLESKRKSKVEVNNKIQQCIQFSNLKAEVVREKAKSNFKIVDFKTKEFTQDGTEQETFKICIDGIEYKDLNTGMKILVAIDLLTGIQKLKDTYVPIIIDNAENLTSDIQVDNTQLIIARAVKNISNLEVK